MGELLYGAINSTNSQKNELAVRKFADHSIIMQIDADVAARYARIRFELKKMGTPIPENDIWIAAACLEIDAPILSMDDHFNFVRGLKVIHWGKRSV